jgi:outer membrane protein assembly factor BamE (lipoprotein component of BamABCDE complex)
MKLTIPLFLAVIAAALSGCATPGQSYAKQHPELSPQQLEILNTGKVPDGTAIAGMTQEQVKLAMGVEPTQYTKVNGQDAWVYVQKKIGTTNLSFANDATFDHRDNRSQHSLAEGESHAPADQPLVKTTIFFQGERATRADVVNGGL